MTKTVPTRAVSCLCPCLCLCLCCALLLAPLLAAAKEPASAAKKSPAQAAQKNAQKTVQKATQKPAAKPTSKAYGTAPRVRDFAIDVAQRRNLPLDQVLGALSKAQRVPSVQRLIMPPATPSAKNWEAYRARFVEPQRIEAGLVFWRDNAQVLQRAEARYSVPASLVVAIIGVETYYGRITGNHRVIDALATLSFDFPAGRSDRSAFFRSELEEFLVLTQREGVDPLSIKGSYAGAMGLPQFMPSSWNKYAVDFDGDGHIDLHGNPADVVGSVAHYLATFGWQSGMPTHYAVQPPADPQQMARLLGPDILPTFSARQMTELGAKLDEAGQRHVGPLALVELFNAGNAPSYVAGTQNFYVVTRYNWSSYYALAVIDLAQALADAR